MTGPRVDQFMTRTPQCIGQEQTLAHAHALMRMHHVRHLPVLDAGRLVGILSVGDLHFIETLRDVDPDDVLVTEAMTRAPYTVEPGAPLGEVADAMARHKYGSAVVVDHGHVVGVFTTVDALRALRALCADNPKRRQR